MFIETRSSHTVSSKHQKVSFVVSAFLLVNLFSCVWVVCSMDFKLKHFTKGQTKKTFNRIIEDGVILINVIFNNMWRKNTYLNRFPATNCPVAVNICLNKIRIQARRFGSKNMCNVDRSNFCFRRQKYLHVKKYCAVPEHCTLKTRACNVYEFVKRTISTSF